MFKPELTGIEINLLIEALKHRASRHESMSRANPRGAKAHDQSAVMMRKLKHKLDQLRTEERA